MTDIRREFTPLFVALFIVGALGSDQIASAADKGSCVKSAADVISDEAFQSLYGQG